MEIDLDKRYQTLRVLWFAMLMNIVIFFVVGWITGPALTSRTGSEPFSLVTFVLAALGGFLVVTSFTVKNKMLERSVDRQDINLVQKAFILAWAICEVSAVIGLVERFVLGNSDYFLMEVIALIGILLHFPKRDHLRSASYKSPAFGGAGS